MINRLRARMTVSLLLCFVLLFASLGFSATYAWFSSSARNEPSLFVPNAGGSGQQCAELGTYCYDFSRPYVSRQEDLIASFNETEGAPGGEADLNGAFLAWWRSGGVMSASFFEKTAYPAAGQVIIKQYSYANDTGIPVYIRLRPELTGFGAAVLGWAGGGDGAWSFDPAADSALAYGGPDGEGYFYLEKPLDTDEEIIITFAFYPLAQNGGELMADLTLEAIQAENNAVYLEPGWKKPFESGYVSYIPYTGSR